MGLAIGTGLQEGGRSRLWSEGTRGMGDVAFTCLGGGAGMQ